MNNIIEQSYKTCAIINLAWGISSIGENCQLAIRKAGAWIANATKRGGVEKISERNLS